MRLLGIWVVTATLAVSASGAYAATGCSRQSVAHTAVLALDANRTLGALPVIADKETDVSVAGRKAIAAIKDRLDAYTVAEMRCAPEKIVATDLKKLLINFAGVKLPESGPVVSISPDTVSYGGPVSFNVRVLSSDMVGVEATIGIACGGDTMLMVFERRGGTWTETLRTQSAPYKTVAGGWWTFDYGISPRDKDGRWFVVTKNLAPWCSSTWSEIRYAVLRPGTDAAHPHTLLARKDSIWWGTDRTGDLKVDARGFDLRWRAESMDDGVHNREWIAHYIVDDDHVYRTAPIAESPRDFADEWVRLDWSAAKNWTAVSAYGLKPLHNKLHKLGGFDYVSIRRCADEDHTQIEVEPVLGRDDRHVFFQVAGDKVLQMRDVSFSASALCKGPNQFDMNKAQ